MICPYCDEGYIEINALKAELGYLGFLKPCSHCHGTGEIPAITVFISGHRDLSQEEFNQHYAPKIDKAIKAGCFFVVGDAHGADCMAQRYLWKNCEHHRVTVFHAFAGARNSHGFKTVGRFPSQTAKDAAMTEASDKDILWIRKGKDSSGTARNLQRRKAKDHETETA